LLAFEEGGSGQDLVPFIDGGGMGSVVGVVDNP